MNIEQSLKDTLSKATQATGLDLAITGGAVRDMLHNKMPKDLDFEILGLPREPCNFEYINANVLQPLLSSLEKAGATGIKAYTEYEGASLDAHVRFVVKCRFNNWYCDFILRAPHPATTSEVVEMYDMNLNQVCIYKGRVEVHSHIVGDIIEPTGKRICIKRLRHIQAKYPEYNFTRMIPYTYEEAELREDEY